MRILRILLDRFRENRRIGDGVGKDFGYGKGSRLRGELTRMLGVTFLSAVGSEVVVDHGRERLGGHGGDGGLEHCVGGLPCAKIVIPGCDGEIVLRIGVDGFCPCLTCGGRERGRIRWTSILPAFRQCIGKQRHLLASLCGGCSGGMRISAEALGNGEVSQSHRVGRVGFDGALEKIDCACVV